MDSKALIAKRLVEAKARSGLSVKAICRSAPFDERQWYAIQRGEVGLGRRKAKDLARVLNVDPGWLLGLEGLVDEMELQENPAISSEDQERLELLRQLDQGSKTTVDAILRLAALAQADKTVAQVVRSLVSSYAEKEEIAEEDESPRKKRKTGT